MTGMGTSTRATQPRSVPVQLTLSALNMYVANSGKTQAASDRRKVLAAMAEAALRNDELAGLEKDWGDPARTRIGLAEYVQHEISIDNVVERLKEDG